MSSPSTAAPAAAPVRAYPRLNPVVVTAFLLPAIGTVAAARTSVAAFTWLTPAVTFLIVPMLDAALSRRFRGTTGSDAPGPRTAGRAILVAIVYLDVIAAAWTVRHGLSGPGALAGLGLSIGIVVAFAARAVETGPRNHALATLSGIPGLIGVFGARHAAGRTASLATPSDPVSARMGESLYAYIVRSYAGVFGESWRSSVAEDGRRFSASREIVTSAVGGVAVYGVLTAWAGTPFAVVAFVAVIVAAVAAAALRYRAHYGLLREHDGGIYDEPGPGHYWHDPGAVSPLLLLDAPPAAGSRPSLAVGSALAMLCAFVPPLWGSLMNPRVAAAAAGDLLRVNLDGDAYATLMARYHRPHAPDRGDARDAQHS